MSYRDYGYAKRYDPYEARVRRLIGRILILVLFGIVAFCIAGLLLP